MGAILADDILHHNYWRSTSKPTITTTDTNEQSGFEFVNMFDNNAHTSYMLATNQQGVTIIDFGLGVAKTFNGFAIHGHNLTPSQGIKLEYSVSDGTTFVAFTDSAIYPADAEIKPDTSLGHNFGVYRKEGSNIAARYLKITTIGWTTDSFISNLFIGLWQDGINVSTPYTPPNFALREFSVKRNNEGNFMSSETRKIPQKLRINLNTLNESDLEVTAVSTNSDTQFGTQNTLINYLGHFVTQFPFFIMHDTGSGTNAEIKAKRNEIYFCTADKSVQQPSFKTPTTLNWSINAIGYIT